MTSVFSVFELPLKRSLVSFILLYWSRDTSGIMEYHTVLVKSFFALVVFKKVMSLEILLDFASISLEMFVTSREGFIPLIFFGYCSKKHQIPSSFSIRGFTVWIKASLDSL